MYLRELHSLLEYGVVAQEKALGPLGGLVFERGHWRVSELVLQGRASARVGLSAPQDLVVDDAHKEIRLLSSGETRSGAGTVPERHDAANLIGYAVAATDGRAGAVADLLVNVDVWELRYLVVALGGRRILTDVEWCSAIDAGAHLLTLDLPVEALATAPAYERLAQLRPGYEEVLYRHYTNREYA